MSRKTKGKGMSQGISPELLLKETDGALNSRQRLIGTKSPTLRRVPGLPRPTRRQPPEAMEKEE